MFEIFVHSACHLYHEPCITVSTVAKKLGGGGLSYAHTIGSSLQAANAAASWILGCTYDNDTNHQFMDHILVGVRSRILKARTEQVPFFNDLKFKDVGLEGFPYKVAVVSRTARGGKSEPFYGDRCGAHTFKGGTRSMVSQAVRPHLGEFPAFHGHGLEQRLPLRAHIAYRKQSDKQAAERVASTNFKKDGIAGNGIVVHWSGYGHLILSVILRMTHRATWSDTLWRSPKLRLMNNLMAYHFWAAARFWHKTKGDKNAFIHPITYLSLHRKLVHLILKDITWPADVPYVGARHTEYFIEMRMEACFFPCGVYAPYKR